MPGVVLGYVLAGNPLFDLRALAWALFALIYHAFGFLQNNILDLDYDRKDPSKAHHPLITGEITVEKAMALDVLLLFLMFGVQIALAPGQPIPSIVLCISTILGTLYNYKCKRSLLGPVFITGAFGTLVMVPYLSYGVSLKPFRLEFSLLMTFLVGFSVFLMLYQISVEGYLKDMKQVDEVNLLRAMGSTLNNDELKLSLQAEVYANSLAAAKALMLAGIFVVARTAMWAFLGCLAMTIAFYHFSAKLVAPGAFHHDKRVKQMALVEVFSYFALVFAIEGVIGWMGVVALIALSMLWFVVMNKVMWRTVVTPRV